MGYIEFSMSERAMSAYMQGLTTLSQLTKEQLPAGWTIAAAKRAAKSGDWKPSEWHHTSKCFNKTDFYDPEDLACLEPNNYKVQPKEEIIEELVTVSWKIWNMASSRYHNMTAKGIKKGNWIFLESGKKLSINKKHLTWKGY